MTEVSTVRAALLGSPGLSQVARASGVSRSTLYNFLAGSITPRPATLARIADGLNLLRSDGAGPAPQMSAAGRIFAEVAYATTLARSSPRVRAKEVASGLLERVSATKDLPYLREEVAMRLGIRQDGRPAELSLPQRLALARVRLESGSYDQTLALLADVPRTARGPWQVARWLASEALRMQGRLADAQAAAEDAVGSRDATVRAWAHWNLAKIFAKRAQAASAKRHFRAAIHAAVRGPIPEYEAADVQAWSLWGMAWLEVRGGGPDAAIRTFRHASEIAPYGDGGVQVWIAHGLAHVLTLTGALDEARELYGAALELTDTMGNEAYKSWMYSGLAGIALTQGAYGPAADLLDRAERVHRTVVGEGTPGHSYVAALKVFTVALLGRRRWAEAHAEIAGLARTTRETGYVVATCEISLVEGESARLAGAIERASEVLETTRREAAAHRFDLLEAHALLALSTVQLLQEGATARSAGRRNLGRAARAYDRWQCRWGLARCRMLAYTYGGRVDLSSIRALTVPSYPSERAELDVIERGTPPATPLFFPGS